MKALFFTIYILCTLSVEVSTLVCKSCFAIKKECDEMQNVNCTAKENVCYDMSVEMKNMKGEEFQSVMKGCGMGNICKPAQSIIIHGVQTITAVKCCKTNLCNSASFLVSVPKSTFNGMKCYSCTDKSSKVCQSVKTTVECSGDQTVCFKLTEEIDKDGNKKPYITKGCASKGVCKGFLFSTSKGITVIDNVHCCEGSLCNNGDCFSYNWILLAVASILLLKPSF
ncbi:urokinase plasminogen activator surface receptor-like [Latimeria chalumnae]|uniref:UPAR/Ly6 domain-containing protein n=1 Tax=Latimeria chalumnae TaxID=7897 RepID=M3XHV4_LATCH|nr:PREDICTED: urokinase plasminogen activator surface receptor-like [Latimeria chalumnae]|eukprot:XP_014352736.1 PREDICTED: urokinase plasminogen activator surface receptor-like [Latimeria chalumnae]